MAKSEWAKGTIILCFLRNYISDHGYPPSIHEIQDGCGLSSTSVTVYNLNKLERAGLIRRDPERARAIVVLEKEGS